VSVYGVTGPPASTDELSDRLRRGRLKSLLPLAHEAASIATRDVVPPAEASPGAVQVRAVLPATLIVRLASVPIPVIHGQDFPAVQFPRKLVRRPDASSRNVNIGTPARSPLR